MKSIKLSRNLLLLLGIATASFFFLALCYQYIQGNLTFVRSYTKNVTFISGDMARICCMTVGGKTPADLIDILHAGAINETFINLTDVFLDKVALNEGVEISAGTKVQVIETSGKLVKIKILDFNGMDNLFWIEEGYLIN